MDFIDSPLFQESMKEQEEQKNQSVPDPIINDLKRESYVRAWRDFDKEKNYPFATLKELEKVADKVDKWKKRDALKVVSRLYFFNSRVKVYQNDKGNQLLVLPDAKVVIDLFNYTSDIFLGNNKEVSIEECVLDILCFIGCKDYYFYFLRDAIKIIDQISDIPRFPERTIKKGDVIFQGTFMNSNASEAFMNFVFHGNYNWTSNSKGNLEYSLYPDPVICYESLAYIKDERDYCIDLKTSIDKINLDDYLDDRQIVLLSRFSPNNPDAEGRNGETAIKFLGMYWLDRKRSREENRLVYKFVDATYKLF